MSVEAMEKTREGIACEAIVEAMKKELEARGEQPLPISVISSFAQPPLRNGCKRGVNPPKALTMIGDTAALKGPYSRFPITLKEAESQVTGYSARIFSAWAKLNKILQGRESALRKRWMKKSVDQRKKILLKAWPEMPAKHRPDLRQAARTQASRVPTEDATAAFKWPHISLEDLTPVNSLLLLLNSRGRNQPHVFAHFDLAACSVGLLNHSLKIADLDGHVMVIVGQETEEDFGRIMSWDGDYEALILFLAGVNFDTGMGLLALEVQGRILEFLLECCYRIFHDIPRDELCNIAAPPPPEPGAICIATSTSYLQSSAIAAEAPFKAPAKLDTHRLLALLEAKRTAAEDHLWEMREDPGYFQAVLLEGGEHRHERVPDINGKLYEHHDDKIFWNDVITHALDYGYMNYFYWNKLTQLAREFHAKARPVLDTLDHKKPLPQDIEDILLDLISVGRDGLGGMVSNLSHGVATSSYATGMKYVRETERSAKRKPFHRVITQGPRPGDQLMMLLVQLVAADKNTSNSYGLHDVVDEIQRLIHDSPQQKRRLTSYVSAVFSDLALLSTIIRQLFSFFPWSSSFERKMAGLDKLNDSFAMDGLHLRETLDKDHGFPGGAETSRIQLPITVSLLYPAHKAHNEANVRALRRAESNLDAFWGSIDDFFLRTNGESLLQLLCKYTTSPRELHRTPEWVQSVEPLIEQPQATLEDVLPLKRIEFTPEKSVRFRGQKLPTKVKTRGHSDTSKRTENMTTQLVTASDSKLDKQNPLPCIPKLSSRATKVFCTIFCTPGSNKPQHEISWKDFLHSMTSIGFAAEKLYGSVWHFTPETFEADRSIHVHEPHPSGKIAFYHARGLGRRLNRNYGWTGDMFASKE